MTQPAIGIADVRFDLTSNLLTVTERNLTESQLYELREFLHTHVSGFDELEALLFLARAPRQAWASKDVGAVLELPDEAVQEALENLAAESRAIEAAPDAEGTRKYRYVPDEEQDRLVECLRRAFDEEPGTVLRLMSANAIVRVRSAAARRLAAAFGLRKREE